MVNVNEHKDVHSVLGLEDYYRRFLSLFKNWHTYSNTDKEHSVSMEPFYEKHFYEFNSSTHHGIHTSDV